MTRPVVWCAVIVALVVVLVGCGTGDGDRRADRDREAPATGEQADLVGSEEFAERMNDPDAVVVNVHVPYEGEIADTDLFVPFDEITSSDRLPSEEDRPLLVYCRTGNMSASATADLLDAGYTDVTDLEGGMVAWEASGRQIEVAAGRDASPPDEG